MDEDLIHKLKEFHNWICHLENETYKAFENGEEDRYLWRETCTYGTVGVRFIADFGDLIGRKFHRHCEEYDGSTPTSK